MALLKDRPRSGHFLGKPGETCLHSSEATKCQAEGTEAPQTGRPMCNPRGVLAGRETKRLTPGVIGLRNGKKGRRVNHHTRESSSTLRVRCCRRLPRSLLPLVAAVLLLQYRCSTRGRCCGRSRRGLNPRPSTAGWVGRIANTQRCLRRRVQQPVCAAADASTPPAKVPPRLDLSLKCANILRLVQTGLTTGDFFLVRSSPNWCRSFGTTQCRRPELPSD